jgi:K+-transporting ATPase KdpF subunit
MQLPLPEGLMNMFWIAGATAFGLFVYLVYALLRAEDF